MSLVNHTLAALAESFVNLREDSAVPLDNASQGPNGSSETGSASNKRTRDEAGLTDGDSDLDPESESRGPSTSTGVGLDTVSLQLKLS